MLAVVPWPVASEDVASYVAAKRGEASEEIAFSVVAGGRPIGVASMKRPGTGNPPRTHAAARLLDRAAALGARPRRRRPCGSSWRRPLRVSPARA